MTAIWCGCGREIRRPCAACKLLPRQTEILQQHTTHKEKKMIPTPGRIVEYTLSEQDAEQVNRRRHDVGKYNQMLVNTGQGQRPATGEQIHVGNDVKAGDTYPMVIVRVWGPTEESAVNGQVMLDGNDTLWITSASQGEGERRWRPFPRS